MPKLFSICFLFLISCSVNNEQPDTVDTTSEKIITDTSIKPLALNPGIDSNDLQRFENGEIIHYCVLLPLKEFKENYADESTVKAQHKFVLRSDPKAFDHLDVQGFIIDKHNLYNLGLFFNRDKMDIEESGLGIDTSYIDTTRHYYVIKGYLPNDMDKKFVQITWVKEDKVDLTVGYPSKKEATWKKRLNKIILAGVDCKD